MPWQQSVAALQLPMLSTHPQSLYLSRAILFHHISDKCHIECIHPSTDTALSMTHFNRPPVDIWPALRLLLEVP